MRGTAVASKALHARKRTHPRARSKAQRGTPTSKHPLVPSPLPSKFPFKTIASPVVERVRVVAKHSAAADARDHDALLGIARSGRGTNGNGGCGCNYTQWREAAGLGERGGRGKCQKTAQQDRALRFWPTAPDAHCPPTSTVISIALTPARSGRRASRANAALLADLLLHFVLGGVGVTYVCFSVIIEKAQAKQFTQPKSNEIR
jgi:hypothetical protein